MLARRSGTNTRQGKRQGQAAKQPDPLAWGCNAGITKIEAQEGKGEPDDRLCVLTRRAIYVRVSVSTVADSFSGVGGSNALLV